MQPISTIAQLETIYGAAVPASVDKVVRAMTPHYRTWIEASKFVVLGTVGPEGTDTSPRGDDGPVVRIVDDETLLLPDWLGNNRIDTLRNIVRDNRISLMFMVPGCKNVVRINGTAIVTDDVDIRASFDKAGRQPRSVIVISINEMYIQCAKAIMRAGLWTSGDQSVSLPTTGEFLQEAQSVPDAAEFDAAYPAYAKPRMW
ncbi:pyridoxamine 5'-phosphate oxidase family protein [Meridianimarinicoccus aquatilis]|uniref:Pyridoxamine 5'-phosphate oxidase family protein n=1 Tax=Meridianimarinicoccus aquatilis TaxID=2552766 RepID=A0A4R6B0B1_9RHOB|nr:pyridoxamine 5'-phosphate oxidase family protein [Fluviibacterium aquatile]TDL89504.1 pyridoxamine 5'-phosphate oxidase family protein [Fluviibacterium aquatile]